METIRALLESVSQTFEHLRQFMGKILQAVALFIGLDKDLVINYGGRFLEGIPFTFLIVALSMVLGAAIALPTAFARMSKNPFLRSISLAYVYFFRGTPLLAQAYLFYVGLGIVLASSRPTFEEWGVWWILRDGFYYVIVAFALNTGAYQAEILRGAIKAVPIGQIEAGLALGLTKQQVFRKITWPQALVLALRPLGNELILMIKASAVASIFTVYEVMGVTRLVIYPNTYNFEIYLWAAVVYLVLVEAIRRMWDAMEHRMTRHLRPLAR